MKELAKKSKQASRKLNMLTPETRSQVLKKLASEIEKNTSKIIEENKKDLENGLKMELNAAMMDRLKLDEKRIKQMVEGVLEIEKQKEVVGEFYGEFEQTNGLQIKKQRVPLGVILMIFESRPNVVVDCAALAIKSSNAIILKGGKEAKYSNHILGEIIQNAISEFIPKESVQVLASDKREVINDLLELKDDIDVVIPRGGHKLIEYITQNSTIPVIAHYQGLCHMYLDKEADIEKAVSLALNAKTQRPGVCNAIETLLVHKDLLPKVAESLTNSLKDKGTTIKADQTFIDQLNTNHKLAVETAKDTDWSTEYLDNILSIKTVDSIDQAIEHIGTYGSRHSECIVSENEQNCQHFLKAVDASCVMINASTRFNDGGQLGLGAELGISTTKLHAYGPMGAEQMTTARYVVVGNGQVRN